MNGRKKAVTRFIIALLTLQGLYVLFPLPDIWPVSNYSMFSRASKSRFAESIQVVGITKNGEVRLTAQDVKPVRFSKIRKGIKRIIYKERYESRNEKRINRIAGALDPPFDKAALKEFINKKLLYGDGGGSREEKLESVFRYLSAQYKRNGGSGDFSEMRLYRARWDWTDVKPSHARMERTLIYSTKTGIEAK